eukprot:scaffold293549_cov36-Prasinocladus_malaysianus.AAC.2
MHSFEPLEERTCRKLIKRSPASRGLGGAPDAAPGALPIDFAAGCKSSRPRRALPDRFQCGKVRCSEHWTAL